MFNLVDMQQQRTHKVLSAKEIIDRAEKAEGGPRPITQDEQVIFDRLTEEIGKLDEQIAAAQAHQRRAEAAQNLLDDLERPQGRVTSPATVAPVAAATTMRVPAVARRTGVLKAFKPRSGETSQDCDLRAYRAGMWLRARCFNDVRAQGWCQTNGVGLDIRGAMSTTSNTDGGFLVADELASAIIDLRETYGIFRRECRVWPMGSDTLMVPRRLAGITIGPIGENPSSAISQSTPTFNQITLVAKKCGGLSLLSSEIAEDAVIDLADWVANEFAYAFSLFEDTVGFTGDGTSAHLGIRGLTNVLTGTTLKGAVQAASGHDTMAEIDNADLTTVIGALPQYALPNAKWYCSTVANALVFNRLQAVAGGNNVMTLQGNTGNSYLGYPIVISQVLPTSTGTINGTPILYFGDLSKAAHMGDRRTIRIFPSEHRYMDTDQIGIRGVERFDVVIADVGDNSTAGPIVALIGKT